jgi:hypothetical protein
MHFHKNSLKYNMLSCIINPDRHLYRTNFCLRLDSPCIRRTGQIRLFPADYLDRTTDKLDGGIGAGRKKVARIYLSRLQR